MFNSIRRSLVINRKVVSCPTPCNVRVNPFSSNKEPKSISESDANVKEDSSLIANYLISTFGFSEQKALATSKYLKFNSPDQLESVLGFLKNRGLSENQIRTVVRLSPQILRNDPHKSFMPKIEFFESSGISQTEVNNIFLKAPTVFSCSLENQIIPSFNFIKSLFHSTGASLTSMKRLAPVFTFNLESILIRNIEILRDTGVPDSKIVMFLQNRSRALGVKTEKFEEVVKEVKEMNFDPCKSNFTQAIMIIRETSKLVREKKAVVYKKWGLSEDDILLAFRKQPNLMIYSTDKITAVMDFLINEMELDYSFVVERPNIVGYSVKNRLQPRCYIYKTLVANGLIKKGHLVNSIFFLSAGKFLNKFVHPYEKEVPELLESYLKLLAVPEKR